MKTLAIAVLCAAGLSLAHAAPDADQPASPRDLHAAECVAALEVNTEDLAKQVKSGKEPVRPVLLARLIAGTAFVGDTYLHGNSDEKQARALANQALEAQKTLAPAELAARQLACAKEGTALYDDSNGLEKVVVKRLAKKRMEKLLSR
jgi:hypothetical protein